MTRPVVLLLLVLPLAGCASPTAPLRQVVDVSLPAPAAAPAAGSSPPPTEVVARVVSIEATQEQVAAARAIDGDGFVYLVPSGWEELDPTTLGSPLILSAQRNGTPVDRFMTNVNVASEAFVGDGPAYADANLVELQKVCTVRGRRGSRVGTRVAVDIECFWPNPGGERYVTLQRYATSGGRGFVITCSAAASAFQQERPICDRVLDSFRVE